MKTAHRHHRRGKWLPADQRVLDAWLAELIDEVAARPRPLHPAIAEFKAFIESDPEAYMLFHQMFEEVPKKPPYDKDPFGAPQVRDYRVMLNLFNAILTRAPQYNSSGVVGFPINAILDWPMGTRAGSAAFLDDRINARFRRMLNEWARYLKSPHSCAVLTDDPDTGWLGSKAMAEMPRFEQTYVCDPAARHYGFTSWDDFFTRRLRPGARPIASPEDDAVIVNPCESAPYRIAPRVKARDRFWIKGQPYSLEHMLAADPLARKFAGGTVYQAFLSVTSYHRWHSPVSGTVVKAYVQPGAYYAESLAEGFDPVGPGHSMAYITEVATRGLIFIEADNPDIGLLCFVPVGMAEVSSCDIAVYVGQHVEKGDMLGTYHFGGSTQCLVFGPRVKLRFDVVEPTGEDFKILPVNAALATAG